MISTNTPKIWKNDYTSFFFFLINSYFIYLFYLFWAVLGLRFVRGLSLVAASRDHSSSQCTGLSTIAAPPVAGHRLQTRRLSSCGSRAQLLRGMWDLPRPGLEPVSSALAGRFSTTAPPGKPLCFLLIPKPSQQEPHCASLQESTPFTKLPSPDLFGNPQGLPTCATNLSWLSLAIPATIWL